jgi:glyoxylase-like metal-dependent hydrolase (beta-lactamase superfamily II)
MTAVRHAAHARPHAGLHDHVIGDAAFVGDTLFMPDGGSARADFPRRRRAHALRSHPEGAGLPDETRLFMCHDYGPNGRDIRLGDHGRRGEGAQHPRRRRHRPGQFVAMREARDATLAMPKLIIPSLQVNMRAGNGL